MHTDDDLPMELLHRFRDDLGKMFFFAGAGISIASSIPDVPRMLFYTADVFLPADLLPKHRKRILSLQPEIIYEAIIRLTGTRDCLHLWKALHPQTQKSFGLSCQPNVAHEYVVRHAEKYGVPVFTTNFDTMFEDAAKSCGFEPKVYLPNDPPPDIPAMLPGSGRVCICKIHGSICNDHQDYTPDNLLTTITEISRINVRWLEAIGALMERNYICFIGYSGRDIDLFPEIKRFSSLRRTRKGDSGIYWINHFEGDPSDKMSRECEAIRLERVYPSVVFSRLQTFQLSNGNNASAPSPAAAHTMLEELKRETIARELVTEPAKRLLAAELVAKAGRYDDAATLLEDVEGDFSCFSPALKGEFLLFRARLSHELSRYRTCLETARAALQHAEKMVDGVDIRIQARCLISEANRMLIPNDAYFRGPLDAKILRHLLWTLMHFELMQMLNGSELASSGRCAPHSEHEMIEHRIRKTAIYQSILGTPFGGWPQPVKKVLSMRWRSLREESRRCGYAGGIANCGKFLTRVIGDHEAQQEMNKVFDLLTHVTGQELSMRNRAEAAITAGDWSSARKYFTRYYKSARKSGNKLNAVKALLGHACISKMVTGTPSLGRRAQTELERLAGEIEGTFWQQHLTTLCKNIVVSCSHADASNVGTAGGR